MKCTRIRMNQPNIWTRFLVFVFFTILSSQGNSSPGADPFSFFHPSVTITAEERSQLDDGEPIARILRSRGNEVALFAGISVKADGDRLAEWVNQIEKWKKNPHVLAIGRFSNPPRIQDLEGLEFDSRDLAAIRSCRPGSCDLKLSAAEMTQLQQAAEHAEGDSGLTVQQAFHQMILARVQNYLANGQIPPDEDHHKTVQPEARFEALLQHTPFLTERLPELVEELKGHPTENNPGVESFLYWSKERLARKAMVSVTQLTIVRSHAPDLPDTLVVGKDIFSSHYTNASLSVTALMRGEPGHSNYLVYVNRTDLDVLHGILGGVVRSAIEHHLKETSGALEDSRNRLESGPPPSFY